MLRLPDELLLNVGLNLDNVAGRCALARTCHRLRLIGQEALIRTAVCPPQHVWKLIGLLQSHPGLLNSFHHLRLGTWTASAYDAISVQRSNMTEQEWDSCCDILAKSYPRVTRLLTQLRLECNEGFVSTGLAYLIALSPGIKLITFGLNWVRLNTLVDQCFRNNGLATLPRIQGWYEQVQVRMQAQLVDLTLLDENPLVRVQPSKTIPWPTVYITFLHFQKLKRIVVPYARITQEPKVRRGFDVPSNRGPSDPLAVLPLSLEYLCIYYSQWSLSPAPSWISRLLERPPPRLRRLELRYESDLWFTAREFCDIRCGESFVSAMKKWQGTAGVIVSTTFGSWNNQDRPHTERVREPTVYKEGDLVTVIEKRLGIPVSQRSRDANLRQAIENAQSRS